MKPYIKLITATLLLIPVFTGLAEDKKDLPNIILIMVDDMGFSDLGYHGGEIQTPNLDFLAKNGVKYSNFYNSGRCCPTRASLMTGLHPHQTGIGWMTHTRHNLKHLKKFTSDAYQGHLNRQCATIADVLKQNGYATYATGKWHLGLFEKDDWPLQRGFDKYFGCLRGHTLCFQPDKQCPIYSGNELVTRPKSTTDEAFYTTDAFTDHGLEFIKEGMKKDKKPFFWYLAYNAPHWPIQAFEDDIDKYRGKYMEGFRAVRQNRFERQIASGLIDSTHRLSPLDKDIPIWQDLTSKQQQESDLRMAVYAAMIDRVDQNIGKIMRFLKETDQYENTLICFLSDNGACHEFSILGHRNIVDVQARNADHLVSYGKAWSQVGSTPFRQYKSFTHEGGTATPFFIHWPAKIKSNGQWYRDSAHILDVMPTFLEVSGSKYPAEFNKSKLHKLAGVSLTPSFNYQNLARKEGIYLEHQGNASLLQYPWKLVGHNVALKNGTDFSKWELYDLSKDRTELDNLASKYPEKLQEMAKAWDIWARKYTVFPK